jgi:hypothetical protein
VSDHPPVTRAKTAADAGLSDHQRKAALRVAAVPEAEFNRQVDSERPPTVTQIANQGKVTRARTVAPDSELAVQYQTPDPCEILAQFAILRRARTD